MTERTMWILFLLLALVVRLPAQDVIILDLEKTVALALERNPGLKISEKEVAKARAGVGEAYSALLPQVDAYATLQHAWEIQTSRIPNFLKPMLGPIAPLVPGISDMPDYVDIAFGLENTLRYGATVTQPLFLGGAGMAGIRSASAARRMTEHNLVSRRQQLILESAGAFYSCLLAKRVVTVQEEALAQAKANLEIVTKKYNVGMASPFDKMRAEVEVAQLEPQAISARNNYQVCLTQLRTILALDYTTLLEVRGEFEEVDDAFGSQTTQELLNLAMAGRPEIKILDEQMVMAHSNLALARSDFLPKIFFQTDYSYLAMKENLKFGQDDLRKGFNSTITVQVPIFQGLRSRNGYEKAQVDLNILSDMEKQALDGIRAEVEVAHNNFRESREKLTSARKAVELASEAHRLARVMYDEGANTQLDVLSARLALTQAQLSYANSAFEYQVARYQLRKSTGTLAGVL